MQLIFDILGWTGSAIILIAYALNLQDNNKYMKYGTYLNLIGGIFIASNCFYYSAIPPFVSNLIWSLIALLAIYKTYHKRKSNLKKLKHRK